MRLFLLFLLPILFLSGCEFPWTPGPGDAAIQRKLDWGATPGKTLEQLAWVWTNNREIDNYSALLTQDYRFYFDPNEVTSALAGGYQIPESWDRATDVQATGNMFNEAYDISLDILNTGQYDDPDIEGTTYFANNVMLQFYLWSDGPDSAVLASGPCDFEFEKVGNYWLIKSWYDRTGGLGKMRAEYLH